MISSIPLAATAAFVGVFGGGVAAILLFILIFYVLLFTNLRRIMKIAMRFGKIKGG